MAAATSVPKPDLSEILPQVTNRPEALEVVFTDKTKVACDGPGGALGHPRTFYSLGKKGYAECSYCDRVYVYDPDRAGETLEGADALALAGPQGA